MIKKNISYTVDALAGERIDNFILRLANLAIEDMSNTVNGFKYPVYNNNVNIEGRHNDTVISINIESR